MALIIHSISTQSLFFSTFPTPPPSRPFQANSLQNFFEMAGSFFATNITATNTDYTTVINSLSSSVVTLIQRDRAIEDDLRRDDIGAQAFVDMHHAQVIRPCRNLDLRRFSLITRVPRGIPAYVRCVFFDGCAGLVSVVGLPPTVEHVHFTRCVGLASVTGLPWGVKSVSFGHCTSLTGIAGLPATVQYAVFNGCTSIASIAQLPPSVVSAFFRDCTSLTSMRELPSHVEHANFRGCTRLHRFFIANSTETRRIIVNDLPNPADDVRTCTRSGVNDRLLMGVGPDVALLIGCFATAGFNASPVFGDRLETCAQMMRRYSLVKR